MNLRKYEAFYQAAELGSVSRAAEKMGCTQSALSHLLQGLEEELGFAVLTRSRSGAAPTPQGQLLLGAVKRLLQEAGAVEDLAKSIREKQAGTIHIGTFTSVAVQWLPGLIKAFREDNPLVELRLENGDYYDVETWLRTGAVDVGFVTLPGPADCPVLPLLLAILPPDHPLGSLSRLPVSTVEKEPFISLLESSNHDARRALQSAGVTPNVTYTTKDDYAIIAMVAQGLGISIVPELLLQGQTAPVKALELDPPAYRTIALAVPGLDTAEPYLKRFVEFVVSWVQGNGQAHGDMMADPARETGEKTQP